MGRRWRFLVFPWSGETARPENLSRSHDLTTMVRSASGTSKRPFQNFIGLRVYPSNSPIRPQFRHQCIVLTFHSGFCFCPVRVLCRSVRLVCGRSSQEPNWESRARLPGIFSLLCDAPTHKWLKTVGIFKNFFSHRNPSYHFIRGRFALTAIYGVSCFFYPHIKE
jgi:hypothetical protein